MVDVKVKGNKKVRGYLVEELDVQVLWWMSKIERRESNAGAKVESFWTIVEKVNSESTGI